MINMWKMARILVLSVGLSACGFHLQGTHQVLPPQLQQVYINTSYVPHSAIAPELTVALKNDAVVCLNDPQQALITINILSDTSSSRQVGSGASQETRKYDLTSTVSFDLRDKAGKRIYGPVTVSSTLSHYVYSGQVLGNNQEEGNLYQALSRNVIQQILFKLGSEEAKTALLAAQK
jgi:outer membrane lipopolysaccharide assembly protein LptE/RlpB